MISKYEKVGDKIYTTGASGFNSKDLLEIKLEKEKKQIAVEEKKIKELDGKIGHYTNYLDLARKLKKTVKTLRDSSVVTNQNKANNAFSTSVVNIVSSDEIEHPAKLCLEVPKLQNIPVGLYSLKINNLATPKSIIYSGFTSDISDVVTGESGKFTEGTFQINGYDVMLSEGNNIASVRDEINSIRSFSNTSAIIEKISNNNFHFKIIADKTGVENSFTITDTTGVLSKLNIYSNNAATDASLVFNGVAVSRPTNIISDLIVGRNFEVRLLNASTPATININVDTNLDIAKDAIKQFMNQYNDLRYFMYNQTELSEQDNTVTYKVPYSIAGDYEFKSFKRELENVIGSKVTGLPIHSYSFLNDLGIYVKKNDYKELNGNFVQATGVLSFVNDDSTNFDMAFAKNPDAVAKLFQFNYYTNSSDLLISKHYGIANTDYFILDIDKDRPMYERLGSYIQDKVRVIVDGATYRPNYYSSRREIEGLDKSPIDGINMVYTGSGKDIISVNITSGIADKIYNVLDKFTIDKSVAKHSVNKLVNGQVVYDSDGNALREVTQKEGVIGTAIANYKDKKKTKQEYLNKLNLALENKREVEMKKIVISESRVMQSKQQQEQLKAQFDAMNRKD